MRVPKVMSYQRAVTPRSVTLGERLSRGRLHFTGCSAHVLRSWAARSNFHVIYNGVCLDTYQFTDQVDEDAPLMYLGRIEEIKGVHLAVLAAKQSNRKLLIAGNVPTARHHRRYFQERILPQIDGNAVKYVGSIDDLRKN